MGSWRWTLIALIAILIFNLAMTPGFFAITVRDGHLFGSLIDILNRSAPTMLVALGMTLVIATGGIDLSVGAIIAIAGAIAALGVTKGSRPFPVVLAESVGIAGLLGLWNGTLVGMARVQPIVATLVLLVAGRGIAQLLGDGQIITFTDPRLAYFGSGHLFGLPFSITLVVCAVAVLCLVTRATALGLFIECVGDNAIASRFTGINVRSVRVVVYLISGLCAGLAGLLIVAQTNAADSNNAGLYIELDAILAVVLGGTPLTGGRFNFVGTLLGAVMIQALTTTILTRGVPVEWTLVVKAALVFGVSLLQSEVMPKWRSRRATA
jgi:ribose/xylose/arabinose/galactoside ABC-type transport system permease subunit